MTSHSVPNSSAEVVCQAPGNAEVQPAKIIWHCCFRRDERNADADADGMSESMSEQHKLGWGHGSITEHSDGTIEYRQTARVEKAFRVNLSDITTVHDRAATKGDQRNLESPGQGKALNLYVVVLNGHGTTLAEVMVHRKTAGILKAWIQDRITATGAEATESRQPTAAVSIAAELTQLAELHATGTLTDDEYAAAKRQVLER